MRIAAAFRLLRWGPMDCPPPPSDDAEHAIDVWLDGSEGDRWDAMRGEPLADFECPHGFLKRDLRITCWCYGPVWARCPF